MSDKTGLIKRDALAASVNLRGYLTIEYLKYHGPTDAAAGKLLVELAKRYGYSERVKAVPGKTLRDWLLKNTAPAWACKTMARFILEKGFIPESDEQLDTLVVLLFDQLDLFNHFSVMLSEVEASAQRVQSK